MKVLTAVVVQAVLLAIALSVTALRCFVRLKLETRSLTLSDYLVWGGWFCTVAWVACQCTALYVEIDHPLSDYTYSDSQAYLKAVFISCYFFDIGLYFPKASILAFYWWLIPAVFKRMRIALCISTVYLTAALLASILTDTLITRPISHNWSIEHQTDSAWNSYDDFCINWVLNISTDLILFCIPFFILKSLKLRQRQRYGLIGAFSLGLVTMGLSLARFIVYTATDYNLSDADGAAWCTAEMCTAIIVASLPGLKVLITGAVNPKTTQSRSNDGYVRTVSGQRNTQSRKTSSRPDVFPDTDSEVELFPMDASATNHGRMPATGKDVARPRILIERGFLVDSEKV